MASSTTFTMTIPLIGAIILACTAATHPPFWEVFTHYNCSGLHSHRADIDVTKRDFWGETALHPAARKGDEAAVRELVRKGADVNAKNDYDSTPLHKAAWGAARRCGKSSGNSCLNVVDFLVEQGADVTAQDWKGNTFLHFLLKGKTTLTPTQLHQVIQKYGHPLNDADFTTY